MPITNTLSVSLSLYIYLSLQTPSHRWLHANTPYTPTPPATPPPHHPPTPPHRQLRKGWSILSPPARSIQTLASCPENTAPFQTADAVLPVPTCVNNCFPEPLTFPHPPHLSGATTGDGGRGGGGGGGGEREKKKDGFISPPPLPLQLYFIPSCKSP